nr:hypothetical protein DA06_03740 [Georgenia sp. SUBG003]
MRAVAGLRYSAAAISSFVSPRPTCSSTSRSRAVRAASLPSSTRATRAVARDRMTVDVTEGESSDSPAATTRTA